MPRPRQRRARQKIARLLRQLQLKAAIIQAPAAPRPPPPSPSRSGWRDHPSAAARPSAPFGKKTCRAAPLCGWGELHCRRDRRCVVIMPLEAQPRRLAHDRTRAIAANHQRCMHRAASKLHHGTRVFQAPRSRSARPTTESPCSRPRTAA
jgi:hypothetical protein